MVFEITFEKRLLYDTICNFYIRMFMKDVINAKKKNNNERRRMNIIKNNGKRKTSLIQGEATPDDSLSNCKHIKF